MVKNVSLMKLDTRETAKKVMLVFTMFAVVYLLMSICPAAYASGSEIAKFAARGVKYALKFLGILVAIMGAYELFKGFGEGTPGMIRGGSLLVAGGVMFAAGQSDMIDSLVSGIGSF